MKTIDLKTNSYKISKSDVLTVRVSECVAIGVICKHLKQYGLAHIHYKNNHNELLNSLNKLFNNSKDLEIILCGGVNSFIPNFGFIPGEENADRIINYLFEKNLEKHIIKQDIYSDYIRVLRLKNDLKFELKKL